LVFNPIAELDLRQRSRARSTGVVFMLWLLFGMVAAVIFAIAAGEASNDRFSSATAAQIGRAGFEVMVGFLTMLLIFLLPGLAASSIAAERERQALLPIQTSQLGPWDILIGKMTGALAFAGLLLAAILPVIAVTVVVGGAGVTDLLRALFALMLCAVVLVGLSVAASGLVGSTRNAVLLSYLGAFLLLIGPGLAAIALAVISAFNNGNSDVPVQLVYASPVMLVADLVADPVAGGEAPLSAFSMEVRSEIATGTGFDFDGGEDIDLIVPVWVRCLLFQGGLAAVGLVLASRRLQVPAEFER